MALLNPQVWISALWLSLTVLTAVLLGASSAQAWLLASMVGLIPVGVLVWLWNEGPPPTIAEVLHTTEGGR
jgi:hypothetical protein